MDLEKEPPKMGVFEFSGEEVALGAVRSIMSNFEKLSHKIIFSTQASF